MSVARRSLAIMAVSLVLSLAVSEVRAAREQQVQPITYPQYQDYIATQRGVFVLVNFWATWCAPCVEEFPVFIQLREEHSRNLLHIVGISLDYDPASLQRFVRGRDLNFPIYRADMDVLDALHVNAIPMVLLYNPAGEVVFTYEGKATAENLRDSINRFLPRDRE